mmetsp:Transcript_14589/g.21466  ORF Transcript_14589/g.21466 Transcript_14589/m.21466 type:complete len:278 (-) Transcript_14589:282-1115(-)
MYFVGPLCQAIKQPPWQLVLSSGSRSGLHMPAFIIEVPPLFGAKKSLPSPDLASIRSALAWPQARMVWKVTKSKVFRADSLYSVLSLTPIFSHSSCSSGRPTWVTSLSVTRPAAARAMVRPYSPSTLAATSLSSSISGLGSAVAQRDCRWAGLTLRKSLFLSSSRAAFTRVYAPYSPSEEVISSHASRGSWNTVVPTWKVQKMRLQQSTAARVSARHQPRCMNPDRSDTSTVDFSGGRVGRGRTAGSRMVSVATRGTRGTPFMAFLRCWPSPGGRQQ